MSDDQLQDGNDDSAAVAHCSAGTGQSGVLKLQEVVITGGGRV